MATYNNKHNVIKNILFVSMLMVWHISMGAQITSSDLSHFGLFFFFKSDCPYCHQLSPEVKDIEERYHIKVTAISMDGRGLPDFPDFKLNNGIAEKLGIRSVPQLFLYNDYTNTVSLITDTDVPLYSLMNDLNAVLQTQVN